MAYRYCIVPCCKNTTSSSPGKAFIKLPMAEKERKIWLKAISRQLDDISPKSSVYLCEDHFNLEHDMENYTKWKMMGGNKIMKKNAIPQIFPCQKDRQTSPQPVQLVVEKRSQHSIIEDLLCEPSSSKADLQIGQKISPELESIEENFDMLEHDMENYMEWKMMGVQKRMKKNVVPHIFACQENRKMSCSRPTRKVPERRAKQRIIQDLLCEPGTSKAGVKVEQKISTEPESIKKNRKISKGVQANRRKKYRTKSTQYFGHESSQFIPIAPKKPNNDMANYTDFRFTHQNTMERTLNTSVGTCTTYSSTDQMQQTNMSESCEPLLGVYIKEEKLDEIIPCDLCLDVFCSMENLMRHVNDKHMKIEINEEPLEKKIKQENNVEDDIHMNDDSFRVEIKEEIIDQIKKEETEQIEEDIS